MALTIHAVFDGQALRPEESVSLEANKRYVLTVEEDADSISPCHQEKGAHPLSTLLGVATDLGVVDLSERHDDYARRR